MYCVGVVQPLVMTVVNCTVGYRDSCHVEKCSVYQVGHIGGETRLFYP